MGKAYTRKSGRSCRGSDARVGEVLLDLGFAVEPRGAVSAPEAEQILILRETEAALTHPIQKLDSLFLQSRLVLDDLTAAPANVDVDHRQQEVAQGVTDVEVLGLGVLVGDVLEQAKIRCLRNSNKN